MVLGIVHQWESVFLGWMLFAFTQSRLFQIAFAINGIDGVINENWFTKGRMKDC